MKRDEGLQAWRGRPWRKVSYLSLDARYEKARVERQRKTKAYMPKNSNFPVSSRSEEPNFATGRLSRAKIRVVYIMTIFH